jgi:enoyl-CoA hydratase/carnithine racemase
MSAIELKFDAPLARLRLNSPSRRNAMSRAMWLALPGVCADDEHGLTENPHPRGIG